MSAPGKRFRIAFSFAGEKREFVEKVAAILARRFGKAHILYDKYFEGEFAIADLGLKLPELYHKKSDLIVVVLCKNYRRKEWPGLEWRAIHSLIMERKGEAVMLCRFDRATITGLYRNAGFVELDQKTPAQAAALIVGRLKANDLDFRGRQRAVKTADPTPLTTAIPNNLPRLQPFFGREHELAEIARALDPATRTWGTLIEGEGGRGKTALAVRAAFACPPAHFAQIVFVSRKEREQYDDKLRALGGFALHSWLEMLDEIARLLALPEIPKAPPDQRARLLRDSLAGRRTLLVLDNLETLSEPEQDELFTFLEYLPADCKALLTSRRFAANRLLSLPLAQLDQASALQMLEEIARRQPLLAESSEPDRLALWQETRGNALLIRWVAGQVGAGPCRTLREALAHLRTCPPGNDPLAFIFEDLVKSLSDEELRLLAALTHPAQPIPVEALAEIARLTPEQALPLLNALANRALALPGLHDREFAIVPMVAAFLRHQRPAAIAKTARRLKARAYLLVEQNGYQKHSRFPVLDAAWPTVSPSLPLFLAGPNARLQTVCAAFLRFLDFTGRWDELLSLLHQAEAKALAAGDHRSAGWRAYQAGWLYDLRQQAEPLLACADRATEHWECAHAGDRERAKAVRLRGLGRRLKRDYPAAIAAFQEALEVHRTRAPESIDVAICLNDLADAECLSGDYAGAERDFREALCVARAADNAEGVAIYTGNLAALALDQQDWPGAETLAREALPLSEAVGRQELIAICSHVLAQAMVRQGKAAEALPHARRAVDLYTRLGSPDLEIALDVLRECEA